MKPYGDQMVSVRAQVQGYADALRRFTKAAAGEDAVAAYIPLFEALNWAVALDERIKDTWAPEGGALGYAWRQQVRGAETLGGVRYVRNAVHHHWADALWIDTSGRRYPKRYPMRYFEWIWHDIANLPAASRTNGKQIYRQLLAGQPAEHTLRILGEAFRLVAGLVEPATSRSTESLPPLTS